MKQENFYQLHACFKGLSVLSFSKTIYNIYYYLTLSYIYTSFLLIGKYTAQNGQGFGLFHCSKK